MNEKLRHIPHNPVTSVYVSGPVRFPLSLRLSRRDEELPQWEAAVAKHFADLKIPTDKQGRTRLHQQVDPVLLQAPEFRTRHVQFRTKSARALALVEEAIQRTVPVAVVVFDAWSLAEEVVRAWARRRKDWIRLLKKNCRLETTSFHLRDTNGWTLQRPGPHIAVEALVPLLPGNAYRPVTVSSHTYWRFTLTVRIPGLGSSSLLRDGWMGTLLYLTAFA